MLKVIASILLSLLVVVSQANASSHVPVKNKFTYGERIILERYSSYIDLISEASEKTGTPMNELAAFVKIESTFNRKAYNKQFKAAGLLGHIPSTWEKHKRLYGKQMGIPRNADVYNARASLFIGSAALADERVRLAKATHKTPEQIQSGDLYLSHMYGFDRAVKILNAPAGTKINKFVKINYRSGLTFHKGKRVMTTTEFRTAVNKKLDKEKSLYYNRTRDYQLTKLIRSLEDHGRKVFAYNQ